MYLKDMCFAVENIAPSHQLTVQQRKFVDEYIMINTRLSALKITNQLVDKGLAENAYFSFDKRGNGKYKVYPKVALYLDALWRMGFLNRVEVNNFDAIFDLK